MPQLYLIAPNGHKLNIPVKLHDLLVKVFSRYNKKYAQNCKNGTCTQCKCKILRGGEGLSELSLTEKRFRAQKILKANERLACQTSIVQRELVEVQLLKKELAENKLMSSS